MAKRSSVEWRKKISLATKRAMQNPTLRNYLSRLKKGKPSTFTGKKHTPEAKEKNRLAHLGKLVGNKNPNWKGIVHECRDCGKKISRSGAKFCTKHARIGKRNYRWKGNLIDTNWTSLKCKIKKCFRYNDWRIKVFYRDKFKCIFCSSNKRIEADHYPIAFAELLRTYLPKSVEEALNCDELWSIENGRTLCHECHKKYGKKLNQHLI